MPVFTCYKSLFLPIAFILAIVSISTAANAGIVTSSDIVEAEKSVLDREQIRELLTRDDVKKALAEQGVDPVAAQRRVESMTTAEVQMLAAQMDQLPAGAGLSTIELLLIIIIIILLV